jgi:hypothetical protein
MSQQRLKACWRFLIYSYHYHLAGPQKISTMINSFQPWSYHSHRISLFCLHTFAKGLIGVSNSTSCWLQNVYRISIELVMTTVLHPHKTLLHPLPDIWLSIDVMFVPSMNRAFSLDTDPVRLLRGACNRERKNDWEITADNAYSSLCDKLKCSVDKSGYFDDGKQIVC